VYHVLSVGARVRVHGCRRECGKRKDVVLRGVQRGSAPSCSTGTGCGDCTRAPWLAGNRRGHARGENRVDLAEGFEDPAGPPVEGHGYGFIEMGGDVLWVIDYWSDRVRVASNRDSVFVLFCARRSVASRVWTAPPARRMRSTSSTSQGEESRSPRAIRSTSIRPLAVRHHRREFEHGSEARRVQRQQLHHDGARRLAARWARSACLLGIFNERSLQERTSFET
jgi:hypothetical protein